MTKSRAVATGLLLILLALPSPFAVAVQTRQHAVATGEYLLDLPSAQWQPITSSRADYPRDFSLSDDKGVVRLRIRRQVVRDKEISTTDVAERQRQLDRSSKRGYVTRAVESFEGAFSGTKYSYEYVTSGKPMAGVTYYLRVTDRAVYRIEFTGPPKTLSDISGQMESIARSFRLK